MPEMLEIEPQETGGVRGVGPEQIACRYLDLLLLHSAAVFKILAFRFRRGLLQKNLIDPRKLRRLFSKSLVRAHD